MSAFLCEQHAQLILTWQGRHHDQEGGSATARLSHCTPCFADPCEFPKCGNLDCIISGSGGLRSRSPLIKCRKQAPSTVRDAGKHTTWRFCPAPGEPCRPGTAQARSQLNPQPGSPCEPGHPLLSTPHGILLLSPARTWAAPLGILVHFSAARFGRFPGLSVWSPGGARGRPGGQAWPGCPGDQGCPAQPAYLLQATRPLFCVCVPAHR